jgi:hypothetical protein
VLSEGIAFKQVGRGQLQGNGGAGLGLIITRQLLALHPGSQLRIDSPGPGEGTTFEIELVLPRMALPVSVDARPKGPLQPFARGPLGALAPSCALLPLTLLSSSSSVLFRPPLPAGFRVRARCSSARTAAPLPPACSTSTRTRCSAARFPRRSSSPTACRTTSRATASRPSRSSSARGSSTG